VQTREPPTVGQASRSQSRCLRGTIYTLPVQLGPCRCPVQWQGDRERAGLARESDMARAADVRLRAPGSRRRVAPLVYSHSALQAPLWHHPTRQHSTCPQWMQSDSKPLHTQIHMTSSVSAAPVSLSGPHECIKLTRSSAHSRLLARTWGSSAGDTCPWGSLCK
jgi:hypothetical protein